MSALGSTNRTIPTRPRRVTEGLIIVTAGVVLAFFLLLMVFTLTPPEGSVDAARIGVLIIAGVIVTNAIAAILIALGYGWARFLLILSGVVGIVSALVAGGLPTFGDALYILAIVLFFLPQSNEYFAARAAIRSAT